MTKHVVDGVSLLPVKIEFTIHVSAEDWDLNFGTGTSAAAVRADVKSRVPYLTAGQFDSDGVTNRLEGEKS